MVKRSFMICICSALATLVARADTLKGDVDGNGRITLADVRSLAGILAGTVDPYGGHAYVDLGLKSKTLWASTNIGAGAPEQAGYYFAWGETIWGKDSYDWLTYDHCAGNDGSFLHYCTSKDYGTVDNLRILLPAHDAATQLWGRFWRMPSFDEQQELFRQNTQWRTQQGTPGLWVQGPSYDAIFLPAAGYYHNEGFYEKGEVCSYWLNELSRGG
ncbi:MAG: hypothetical protein KBT12_03485, partial [Bacteroidales bacterium]|nr:hypothetical protein [Candidatus Physcousia equi]